MTIPAMKKTLPIIALCMLLSTTFAHGGGFRELDQRELRSQVSSGQVVPLRKILRSIKKRVSGDIVDVRAFSAKKTYIRVLILRPNGKFGSVVADAKSGKLLSGKSRIATQIVAFANGNEVTSTTAPSISAAGSEGRESGSTRDSNGNSRLGGGDDSDDADDGDDDGGNDDDGDDDDNDSGGSDDSDGDGDDGDGDDDDGGDDDSDDDDDD